MGLAYHHIPYDESVVPRVPAVSVSNLGTFSAQMQSLVSQTNRSAPAWAHRDARVLVGPMRWGNHPDRDAYKNVLQQPQYAHLVHIVDQHLSVPGYLRLLAEHRAVLSPPGMGYDCFRHWEALAVGSVPLVKNDA